MQNPFSKQLTVSSVMAAFTSTIDQLTTVADNNDSIVSNLQVQQEELAATMAEARTEAENARTIRAKLTAIVEA